MRQLNSDNAPIRVDFLPMSIVKLPGRIGLTIAPGKKARGIHGKWNRDLDKDLRRLKSAYGIGVLACLLESDELDRLQIADLPESARELGFQVLQLPIPDGGVPPHMERLRVIVAGILEAAASGRTIAIHCRGGLGRSGLVGACCLVALGVDANKAMEIVRAARQGAIENQAQEDAVRSFHANVKTGAWSLVDARGPSSGTQSRKPPFDRFLGCLVGGGVGDALGYPVEFVGPGAAIVSRFGKGPPAKLDYAGAGHVEVSDDTQMSLFVAEGIIRAVQRFNDRGLCSVPAVLLHAMLRWYDTQTTTIADMSADSRDSMIRTGWLRAERLYARRAPGNTCLSSLKKLSATDGWQGVVLNDSKGCGAIMRSAPIGLGAGDRQLAFRVACESGIQTHGHPLGYLPAGYLASVVFDVARGVPLNDALALADELLREEANGTAPASGPDKQALDEAHRRGANELLLWIKRARGAAVKLRDGWSPEVIERLGAGWTGEEALAISLCCALAAEPGDTESVARAMWAAVAHGGDSDSTGAITGNILGATCGVEVLPRAWVEQVELRDIIERLSGDLYAVTVGEVELDNDLYPPN